MSSQRKMRVLVGKPGLDGHDRGAKVIARALRDAGFEVIYSGLHQTPEMLVTTAIQESVDCIGLSILSGAHNHLMRDVLKRLAEADAEDIFVFGGGVIPADDAESLVKDGIAAIFTPGTPTGEVVTFLRERAQALGVGRENTKLGVLLIFVSGLAVGVSGTVLLGDLVAAPTERLGVVHFDEGDAFELAAGKATISLLLDANGGAQKAALSVLESKPGWKVPTHAHAASAEVLYILDGEGTFTFDGKDKKVRKGHAVYVPPGLEHSFVATGKRNLKAIQVYAAPGPEQRFRKIGKPLN